MINKNKDLQPPHITAATSTALQASKSSQIENNETQPKRDTFKSVEHDNGNDLSSRKHKHNLYQSFCNSQDEKHKQGHDTNNNDDHELIHKLKDLNTLDQSLPIEISESEDDDEDWTDKSVMEEFILNSTQLLTYQFVKQLSFNDEATYFESEEEARALVKKHFPGKQ